MKLNLLTAFLLSFFLFIGSKNIKPEGNLSHDDQLLNKEVAIHAAKESIVLLKNDNILPICPEVKTIAVIGGALENLSIGKEGSYHSLLKDLGDNVNVIFLQGSADIKGNESHKQITLDSKKTDQDFTQEAIDISKEADLVLVFAGTSGNIDLPENQNVLIEAVTLCNNNVVVILSTSHSVSMPWKNNVKGIVQMRFGGEEIAPALASMLAGE